MQEIDPAVMDGDEIPNDELGGNESELEALRGRTVCVCVCRWSDGSGKGADDRVC